MTLAPADLWPWATLAAIGAFHGLNPAMGWLFAVAFGLHRGSRRVLFLSLGPILEPIRGDPRFTALKKRVGLPAP